jgi:hypothetical protein
VQAVGEPRVWPVCTFGRFHPIISTYAALPAFRRRGSERGERSHADGAARAAVGLGAELQRENARLRRQLQLAWGQVGDMKQFLTDYGMVWVGSGSNAADADADVDDERARAGVDAASQPPPFVEHPPGRACEAKATSSAAAWTTTAETATMATDGMTQDIFVADMALLAEKVDELNALAGAYTQFKGRNDVCCAVIRSRRGAARSAYA